MSDRTIGDLSLRTHIVICQSQLRSEGVGRWIPAGLLLLLSLTFLDGMSTGGAVMVAVLLECVVSQATSGLTMSPGHLRVFGVGERAARAHVVVSQSAGTALLLLCVLVLWVVQQMWGDGEGPWYFLTALIVLLIALANTFFLFREIREGGRSPSGGLTVSGDLARLAQRRDGHRQVLERTASAGIVSTIIVFLVLMLPVQVIMRILFAMEPSGLAVLVIAGLVVTTLFVRVIHAERAAQLNMVLGGTSRAWRTALERYMWAVPVAFVGTFVVASAVERVTGQLDFVVGWTFLSPVTLADWGEALLLVALLGTVTQAYALQTIAVTVTKPIRTSAGLIVVAVHVVGIGLTGLLTVATMYGEDRWTVLVAVPAAVGYVPGSLALFRLRAAVVEVAGPSTAGWFGMRTAS